MKKNEKKKQVKIHIKLFYEVKHQTKTKMLFECHKM